MTPPLHDDHDELIVDHQHYLFRDGSWTTPAGLCVSTSQGQLLTNAFFAKHGRVPSAPKVASEAPATSKPSKPKPIGVKARASVSPTAKPADRLRAAIERRAARLSLR